MAISTGTALLGGAVLGGSLLSSNAAKKAGQMQADAANRAAALSERQFDIMREDQRPWMEVGSQSIRTIGDLLRSGAIFPNFRGEDLVNEPGYQFRLAEGNKAIENAARARGVSLSPMTVKELLRYGQDYASGEYQNAFNRDMANKTTKFNMLSGASGSGQAAANTVGNAGMNMAGTVGGLMTGAANARGAAGIAGANAFGNAATTLGGWYMQNQMLDKLRAGGTMNWPWAG